MPCVEAKHPPLLLLLLLLSLLQMQLPAVTQQRSAS
jgi:hypothetical protein